MKPNYEALQRLLDPVDSFSRTPGFFFVLEHVYVLMLNVLQFSESDPRLQNVFVCRYRTELWITATYSVV